VGTYAVQLAKHWGAHVTGVCSGANLDLVRSIGAGEVIDYTREDFRKSGKTYDVVFDTVRKLGKSSCRKSLGENRVFISSWSLTRESNEDLIHLRELVEAGKLRPVIDRTYPLEEVVEAHRYVDKGHKKGNVVITVVALTAPEALPRHESHSLRPIRPAGHPPARGGGEARPP
jgi:NADPH:quinone reductase-like Zn-dependent oxidoreductase